jgi:uncharacterized protein (DUF1330 family)
MVVVAILTVRQALAEQFRDYERGVARIMGKHGGAIERTVVTPVAEDGETFREIHFIRFPDRGAFAAYQADPERQALEPARQALVVATELFVGADGPDYAG